jgi:hypothetical protein
MQEQEVAMHKGFIDLKVRIKFVTFKLSYPQKLGDGVSRKSRGK